MRSRAPHAILAVALAGCSGGPVDAGSADSAVSSDGGRDAGDAALRLDSTIGADSALPDLSVPDIAGADLFGLDLARPPDLEVLDGGSDGPAPDSGLPLRQRFAAFGDYGVAAMDPAPHESDVAKLVKSWNPDFILTTGDNNYPWGEASTIDKNVGQFYADYMANYHGLYGNGSPVNRFFPAIGNHDVYGPDKLQPYLDYFTGLPGNRRYYDIVIGRVHLFAINSDFSEPDGHTFDSVQALWLKQGLAASTACFKVVYFHYPPFSSGNFSIPYMDWPFAAWGADVVLMGHEHHYERMEHQGIPYIITGMGGSNLWGFEPAIPESQVRYFGHMPSQDGDWGASLLTATATGMTYEFWNVAGVQVDNHTVPKKCAN